MYAGNSGMGQNGPMSHGSAESQGLLPVRYPSIPTSAAHLADQMESGGAKVEETLSRFNCRYQSLFFAAGIAVVFGATIGMVGSILTAEFANLVNSVFLIVFGLIMMILDVPGAPRWASKYRLLCRKFVRFLTRLTGKALWFLFLSCMTTVNLWPTKHSGTGMLVLAIFTSFFVICVSAVGLLIAIRKSLRLEKARKSVQAACKGAFGDVYRKYAMTDATHGIQFEEFNRMCTDFTNGKLQFDLTDMGIIYNALDEHQKGAINEREFGEWMTGAMCYL